MSHKDITSLTLRSVSKRDWSAYGYFLFSSALAWWLLWSYSLCLHCIRWCVCLFVCELKVKGPRCRPGVAQRVGRRMALLFHNRGTRRGWAVSSTPRPHFTSGKEPVPILQEAGWAPGPVWTGGKSRPHRDSIPDRPARSQSLYRLSYPAHICIWITWY